MKRILSFGGGLQTTALAIMVAKGELEVDEVVFADTGAEKPETYWYIENYIWSTHPETLKNKPIFNEIGILFTIVRKERSSYYLPNLYDHCFNRADIPGIPVRECTVKYKARPIKKLTTANVSMLIGFSVDEAHRAKRKNEVRWKECRYPLIERQITASDCRSIIVSFGLPIPIKSSCYICPFQKVIEWNWLKNNHPDLFQKALDLEAHYHQRKPEFKDTFGLLGGTPLWKMKKGIQPEMFQLQERSCWSGHCGH